MNTRNEQTIPCINITVLLRCMSHYQLVPCNELNTVAALLEGPVVEIRVHITFFSVMVRTPPDLLTSSHFIEERQGQLTSGILHFRVS